MTVQDFSAVTIRPRRTTFHARFESLAASCPDAPAIEWSGGAWTRQRIVSRMNAIARALQGCGVRKGDVVAIHLPPVGDYLASILAVSKVGGIHLSLDRRSPPAYLKRVLDHSGPRAVLADSTVVESLRAAEAGAGTIVDVGGIAETTDAPQPVDVSPDDLGSLIYTSGSTGMPKGVARSHAYMFTGTQGYAEGLEIGEEDRISHVLPQSGAAARTDMFAGILTGGTLVMFDPLSEYTAGLADWLDEKRITVFHAVPTLFREILRELPEERVLSTVRVVRVGGEAVRKGDLELFNRHFPPGSVKMWSYSCSEASLCTLARFRQGDPVPEGALHSGELLNDPEVLILDERDEPVGRGEAGQIVLRAKELSPGYWNEPGLTNDSFRPCPRDSEYRLFFTGDLGYIDAENRIVMTGRRDFMVKIAGNRVDTSEVEDALCHHPAVREAAVAADTRSGTHVLVAWVALRSGTEARELREFLAKTLPPYMIPPVIRIVEELPLTTTNKLDRKALLDSLGDVRSPPEDTDRARVLVTEIRLVMREALGSDTFGTNDDFFLFGGTSLAAVRMTERIGESLGFAISPMALYDAPTPRLLAQYLLDCRREPSAYKHLRGFESITSGAAIALVPAGGRTALSLERIARPLSAHHPVYIMNPSGLGDGEAPHDRIESMAGAYVGELLAARPEGPLIVCGRCIGGLVAMEMARQIEAAGRTVHAVVVLDTLGVPPPKDLSLLLRYRVEVAMRAVATGAGLGTIMQRLRKKLQKRRRAKQLTGHQRRLSGLNPMTQGEFELYLAHLHARNTYRSGPFDAKLVGVVGTRQARYAEIKRNVMWSIVARGGVQRVKLPGSHSEVLDRGNVDRIVAILRECAAVAGQSR